MVPKCAGLVVEGDIVQEGVVGGNWTLCNKCWTVCLCSPVLKETMPMDWCGTTHVGVIQTISDIQLKSNINTPAKYIADSIMCLPLECRPCWRWWVARGIDHSWEQTWPIFRCNFLEEGKRAIRTSERTHLERWHDCSSQVARWLSWTKLEEQQQRKERLKTAGLSWCRRVVAATNLLDASLI